MHHHKVDMMTWVVGSSDQWEEEKDMKNTTAFLV